MVLQEQTLAKKDVFSTGKNIMLSKYDIMYINRNSTKVACTGTCQGWQKKKKSKNNFPNLKQFLFCLLKSKSCVEKDVTERHI